MSKAAGATKDAGSAVKDASTAAAAKVQDSGTPESADSKASASATTDDETVIETGASQQTVLPTRRMRPPRQAHVRTQQTSLPLLRRRQPA